MAWQLIFLFKHEKNLMSSLYKISNFTTFKGACLGYLNAVCCKPFYLYRKRKTIICNPMVVSAKNDMKQKLPKEKVHWPKAQTTTATFKISNILKSLPKVVFICIADCECCVAKLCLLQRELNKNGLMKLENLSGSGIRI